MRFYSTKALVCVDTLAADALCLPINGCLPTKRGGPSLSAYLDVFDHYSGLRAELGRHLRQYGNNVGVLAEVWLDKNAERQLHRPLPGKEGFELFAFVTFPTKPAEIFDINEIRRTCYRHVKPNMEKRGKFPGWMGYANPLIIERSIQQLLVLVDELDWETVVIPRPVYLDDDLPMNEVLTLLNTLDDRFVLASPSVSKYVFDDIDELVNGVIVPNKTIRYLPGGRYGVDDVETVEVLECYSGDLTPVPVIDLQQMCGNETLYVSGGKAALLSIGPAFRPSSRDIIVEIL